MAKVYFRKGRGWYIDFREGEKRYRERVPGADEVTKKVAEDFLSKRKREVADAIINPRPETAPSMTFSAFADSYLKKACAGKKSLDRDEDILEMFKVEFAGCNLPEITAEMVEAFKAKRSKTRAAATVLKELRTLKHLYKTAIRWGRAKVNPVDGLKMPKVNNGRVRFLEADEIKRLMAKLPEPIRQIAAFCRFTGCRRGEALNLRWVDCDLKRGVITLKDTKTGADQKVMMNATVRRVLESLPSPIDRSQYVFPEFHNAPNKGTWLVVFNREWKRACKAAAVTDFHFHDLRHQAATDLRHAGVDLGDVKEFLRHKTMTMTLRYAHIKDERRIATALVLDGVGGKEMDTLLAPRRPIR